MVAWGSQNVTECYVARFAFRVSETGCPVVRTFWAWVPCKESDMQMYGMASKGRHGTSIAQIMIYKHHGTASITAKCVSSSLILILLF